MATLLILNGWRLYFYSNERHEPPHIHAKKGEMDCKFWPIQDTYDIEEVYAYGLSAAERRALRKIIFEHFDYLIERYQNVHGVDMKKKFYEVEVIQAEQDALCLRVDGETVRIAWPDCSPLLAEASVIEREIIEIAPSGYGLHWPLLDEDLTIGPLLTRARVAESPVLAA